MQVHAYVERADRLEALPSWQQSTLWGLGAAKAVHQFAQLLEAYGASNLNQ
jgi:hypothetical protein